MKMSKLKYLFKFFSSFPIIEEFVEEELNANMKILMRNKPEYLFIDKLNHFSYKYIELNQNKSALDNLNILNSTNLLTVNYSMENNNNNLNKKKNPSLNKSLQIINNKNNETSSKFDSFV